MDCFLIVASLFVSVVVVVKQGINCCNEGPVVRIGVRKLLKGREFVLIEPLRFGVECVPLLCYKNTILLIIFCVHVLIDRYLSIDWSR